MKHIEKKLIEDEPNVGLNMIMEYRRASEERCAPIDARLRFFENEYRELMKEYDAVQAKPAPKGFFELLKVWAAAVNWNARYEQNRQNQIVLVRKRIANT